MRQDQHNYKLQAQRGGLRNYSNRPVLDESFINCFLFTCIASSTLLQKWANEEVTLRSKLAELQSRCAMLEQNAVRTISCVSDTAKAAGIFLTKPSDVLDKNSQLSLELYADLQKRSGEQRLKPENNVTMTKVVVKAFKSRSQLFTDCFTQIRSVFLFNSTKVSSFI